MTPREKASRYDALQVAIRMTVQAYEESIKDYPRESPLGLNPIKVCQYGERVAYENAIRDMKRWLEA